VHILCVNYQYVRDAGTAEELLDQFVTLRECARALANEGARVTVLQRFHRDAELERDGVRYLFRADRYGPTPSRFEIPRAFHRTARDIDATVVQVSGLLFPFQVRALRATLHPSCALVVQDHASAPSRRWPLVQRWCFRGVDGFLFTTRAQAKPWRDRGVITRDQFVYDVLEGSTRLRFGDRTAARARTGLTGAPVVLWVGRLIALKDPLVVLRGFAAISRDLPEARLYMVYQDDTLLPEVKAALPKNVVLLGARKHAELQDLYNSADYFVLGSHSEGSGYALLEALACGVVPVVTDIPSLRQITYGGRIGALWAPGDAQAFAAAFGRAVKAAHTPEAIAADFERRLSFAAIARDSIDVYRDVAQRRARSSNSGT
jgi:glycosyltransferase involved in cell wall biosynthesis